MKITAEMYQELAAGDELDLRLAPAEISPYQDAMDRSRCFVEISEGDEGLAAVRINFSGLLSKIPRKSNSARIYKRRDGTQFVGHDPQVTGQLRAMVSLYRRAVMTGDYMPSFGAERVHVHVWLANRNGRWDSHNTPKAIGDFLEEIKLINNDDQAQIWAGKKDLIVDEANSSTEILVVKWDHACKQIAAFNQSMVDLFK